jgi:hypothetical protein
MAGALLDPGSESGWLLRIWFTFFNINSSYPLFGPFIALIAASMSRGHFHACQSLSTGIFNFFPMGAALIPKL